MRPDPSVLGEVESGDTGVVRDSLGRTPRARARFCGAVPWCEAPQRETADPGFEYGSVVGGDAVARDHRAEEVV